MGQVSILDVQQQISAILGFQGSSLTDRLASIESLLMGATKSRIAEVCANQSIDSNLLESSLVLKRAVGQINVIIHAVGILLALPSILEYRERVEYVSLGAGNTGRPFDVETDRRVAEFKFINWQGGAEAIRQNSLFKDFYLLAESKTKKARYLYVLGLEHPMRFLNGGRDLNSVLSRNVKLKEDFHKRYGDRFVRVHEYYKHRESSVKILDLLSAVPDLAAMFASIDE